MLGKLLGAVFFGLIGIGCFLNGVKGLWVYATNSSPKEVSCAEFLDKRPDADWLTLTSCYPRVDDIVFRTYMDDVFIPVGGAEDTTGPISLVVVTTDETWRAHVEKMHELPDYESLRDYAAEHALGRPLTFSGAIQIGDDDRDLLREHLDDVTSDAAVVEHDAKPGWMLELAFTLFGIGLVIYLIKTNVAEFRRRRKLMKATAV